MRLRIRWKGLRTKIIAWSFVPTAIILTAVALVNFYAYQQVTEELVIERDRDLTRLFADQLAMELTEYADHLTILARTADIYQGDPAAQRDALKKASNRLTVFDGGVLILDTFGKITATEPERPEVLGQDWSDRDFYLQILRSQISRSPGSVFSDTNNDDGPGAVQAIVVAVPITGEQGEFMGTVVGMFRLDMTDTSPFHDDIVQFSIEERGNAYLVGDGGRVIYHSDPDRIGQDFSEQVVVQRVLNGEVDAIRTRDFDNRDIVSSFAPVPGTSWGLVTEESWAALISASQSYGWFLMSLLALGLVVPALVVAFGVSRITQPIVELIGAAQEVARGNFGQEIGARTGDELEELAEQFNSMSIQLQESYVNLERKVADRTRELATLNAIAAVVSRSLDLDEVLNSALDETLMMLKADFGNILLIEPDGETMTLRVHRGLTKELVEAVQRLYVSEGIAGQAILQGKPVVLNVAGYARAKYTERLAPLIFKEGLQTLVSVPIVHKGTALGAIALASKRARAFPPQELELLTAIGQQIGVAVENARLYTSVQQELVERVQAEEALRRERDFAESLVETAQAIVSVLDTEGRIIRFNPYMEEISGYQLEEVQGKDWFTTFLPEREQEHVRELFLQAVSDIQTRGSVNPIVTKDGREREIEWYDKTLKDTDGNVVGLLTIGQDITERKQVEAALRESEEMFRTIGTSAQDAIIVIDNEGSISYWNKAAERMFGYTQTEALGQRLHTFIAPARYHDAYEKGFARFQKTGSGPAVGKTLELSAVRKNGQEFPMELSLSSVKLKDKWNAVGILRDITERKQTEEALRQAKEGAESSARAAQEAQRAAEAANRAKSIFLANMSHELRTPLNAILGFSELMTHDQNLSAGQRENLETINRSGEHLLGLINDVLEMSKIEAGRVTLQKQNFDLHRMLAGLERMFHPRTGGKGLSLIFDRAPDVPQYVRTDENKLRQVLINLLSNAVKFTEGGSITLRVRSKVYEVRSREAALPSMPSPLLPTPYSLLHFEVKDTGIGIAPEELDAVFDTFVQTASGKQSYQGTGLGMPISRRFVRMMGGDITVSSELGKGTTFKFDVPVKLADPDKVQAAYPTRRVIGLEPGQRAADGGPYRLLVAEDEAVNRALLLKLLKPLGFDVREAVNGQEAIEIWEEWQPHLIWMDMRMPVMDGHEATKHIKSRIENRKSKVETVIIALTASAFEEDRATALAAGCDDFVRKPFRETEIFNVLTRHLGVRFVYEETDRQVDKETSRQVDEETEGLMPTALAAMPSEWLADLRQATVEGDLDWMTTLIEQIREPNAALADRLTELADNFEHDVILQLVQRARD